MVRGTAGADRVRVLGAVASALGMALIAVDGAELAEHPLRSLGPVCTMIGAMPVVAYDLGPGETARLPELTGYDGPLGVILGMEGGLQGKRCRSSAVAVDAAPQGGAAAALLAGCAGPSRRPICR